LGEAADELGLAGAGWAVEQNVDAGAACAGRLAEIRQEDVEIVPQVRVGVERDRRRGGGRDVAREEVEQVASRHRQVVGQAVQDVQLVAEVELRAHVDGEQRGPRQQPRAGKGGSNLRRLGAEADAKRAAQAVEAQAADHL